jgi:hypothetical protein
VVAPSQCQPSITLIYSSNRRHTLNSICTFPIASFVAYQSLRPSGASQPNGKVNAIPQISPTNRFESLEDLVSNTFYLSTPGHQAKSNLRSCANPLWKLSGCSREISPCRSRWLVRFKPYRGSPILITSAVPREWVAASWRRQSPVRD